MAMPCPSMCETAHTMPARSVMHVNIYGDCMYAIHCLTANVQFAHRATSIMEDARVIRACVTVSGAANTSNRTYKKVGDRTYDHDLKSRSVTTADLQGCQRQMTTSITAHRRV